MRAIGESKKPPKKATKPSDAPPAEPKQPKEKKPGGRPSGLTQEVHDRIVAAVRAGNFFETACRFAGVAEQTGREWLARGLGNHSSRGNGPAYAAFADAVKKAEADAEAEKLLTIHKAAKGGTEVKTKVTTKYNPDGSVREVVEEKQLQSPEWTAAAWYLERKHPARWGRKTVQDDNNATQDRKVQINITPPKGRTL